jgi:hypothetical protein
MAHQPAHAQRAHAPGLVVGLGRESRVPTWVAARSVNHCLSIPIGRSRVDPGRSKPGRDSIIASHFRSRSHLAPERRIGLAGNSTPLLKMEEYTI